MAQAAIEETVPYEEVYESSHDYCSHEESAYLVEVPGASSYTLEFDSRCRTISYRDRLQLWRNKDCCDLVAMWEGDKFPKEPLVVDNEILYFTFRSTAWSTAWGWKIYIKSRAQVKGVRRFWPESVKEGLDLVLITGISKIRKENTDQAELSEDLFKVLEIS